MRPAARVVAVVPVVPRAFDSKQAGVAKITAGEVDLPLKSESATPARRESQPASDWASMVDEDDEEAQKINDVAKRQTPVANSNGKTPSAAFKQRIANSYW